MASEAPRVPETVLLLPGQGAQEVGMGAALVDAFPAASEVFRRADEILGLPLARLCREGPEGELTRTENAQPAILTHSYAVWSVLPETVRSSVVAAAGHSLGEFTAYLVAGALSFPDALRLVRRRGELMARSREGTMAAVIGLDDETVEAVCSEVEGVVVAANFNAPGQVVVSGEVAAVERAAERASDAGARRVVRLDVSGAFHSPLMAVAREGLAEALAAVQLRDPAFPVVSNATAEEVNDAGRARELLIEQLTSPVRWAASMERLAATGADRWLELGPGSVLRGLARRFDRSLSVTSIEGPEGVRALGAPAEEAGDG